MPDKLAAFNPAQLDRFTLSQTPIYASVPEPSTWLLLGGGLLAALVARHPACELRPAQRKLNAGCVLPGPIVA